MHRERPEPRRDRIAREREEKLRERKAESVKERRSNIAKYTGMGILAAVGLVVAGYFIFGSLNSTSSNETDLAKYFPANRPFAESLRTLDIKLENGSLDLVNVSSAVAYMADKAVCEDLGCNPKEYRGQIELLKHEEYANKYFEASKACGDEDVSSLEGSDIFGHTLRESPMPIFDLTSISHIGGGKRRSNQASGFYKLAIHERLHARAKIVKPENEQVLDPVTKKMRKVVVRRGVRKYFQVDEKSVQGSVCLTSTNIDGNFEEAIVDDQTDRLIKKTLPEVRFSGNQYAPLVDAYRRRVLPLFKGDHRAILNLHQESNPDAVYDLIGERQMPPGMPLELKRPMGEALITDIFAHSSP